MGNKKSVNCCYQIFLVQERLHLDQLKQVKGPSWPWLLFVPQTLYLFFQVKCNPFKNNRWNVHGIRTLMYSAGIYGLYLIHPPCSNWLKISATSCTWSRVEIYKSVSPLMVPLLKSVNNISLRLHVDVEKNRVEGQALAYSLLNPPRFQSPIPYHAYLNSPHRKGCKIMSPSIILTGDPKGYQSQHNQMLFNWYMTF